MAHLLRAFLVLLWSTATMACGGSRVQPDDPCEPCERTAIANADDDEPSPAAPSGLTGAREIQCNAWPDAVSARLHLTEDYEHLVGTATDHYDTVDYGPCTRDDEAITCEGTWRGSDTSGALRVEHGQAGTVVGRLNRHSRGEETLSCMVTN